MAGRAGEVASGEWRVASGVGDEVMVGAGVSVGGMVVWMETAVCVGAVVTTTSADIIVAIAVGSISPAQPANNNPIINNSVTFINESIFLENVDSRLRGNDMFILQ